MRLIPLSLLHSSPRNVRKTGETSIRDLAASIAAHGLLQGLVVTEAAEGRFEVEAGSRRLRALLLLRQEEKIPEDFLVPCRVIGQEEAQQVGLAENVVREAMHPADQFEAFFAISLSGLSDAEIAARYGTTERHVAQILRLARVSPKIMAEYKAGKATLEQLQALAVTDDIKAQERVWKQTQGYGPRDPEDLKIRLVGQEIKVNSKLGRFIKAEYEKAGGPVRRDLFGEDEDAWLVDHGLAFDLAQKKLDELAEEIRAKEGWAWAEGRLTFEWDAQRALGRTDWELGSADCPATAKARSGVVVTIGYHGKPEIWRELIRPEDRKAVKGATKEAGKDQKKGVSGGSDLSAAAVERLQAEVNGLLQAHVAGEPKAALALLLHDLLQPVFYDRYYSRTVYISRDHTGRTTGPAGEFLRASEGASRLEAIGEDWRKQLPGSKKVLMEWLLKQDYTLLGRLLAFLVAREIDAVSSGTGCERLRAAIAASGLDLAKEWRPSERWLNSLTKPQILRMLEDAAGKKAVAQVDKLPKAQLVEQALALFPAGWIPKHLRPRTTGTRKPRVPRGKAAAAGMD